MEQKQKKNFARLVRPFTQQAEQQTLDYVLEGMRESLGDKMPDAAAVEAYVHHPERKTTLTRYQELIAMNRLLECAEINFRTCCDMIRYSILRDEGVVHSVEEYLRVFRGKADDGGETG